MSRLCQHTKFSRTCRNKTVVFSVVSNFFSFKMAKTSARLKCQNPNCGHIVSHLTGFEFEEEGRLRLCKTCYSYALIRQKPRSRNLVLRAEELKSLRGKRTCENPNCKQVAKKLIRVEIEGGGCPRLCDNCYRYAMRTKQLKPAEAIERVQELRTLQIHKSEHCSNPNCKTTQLYNGRYDKDSGEYYCIACSKYRDSHGEDRPKSLIESHIRALASGRGFGKCENRNCEKLAQRLKEFKFEREGWLRLCQACYSYAYRTKSLRSKDAVKEAENRKRRRLSKGRYCFNKNCRSTDLVGGGYGKHNGEFYCRACVQYVNRNYGVERPKPPGETSIVFLKTCENPVCDNKAKCLCRTDIHGKGQFKLCPTCHRYGKNTGRLRSLDMVEKVRLRKRKRAGEVQCHNTNCRTAELRGGGYAKWNGEYYCDACRQYVDKHGGEERPKKLVEKERLKKSRYMWQLKHPDIPEDCT